ncbi:MAG: GAF domain-containing protein, partial [Pseudomonadota bacterium]
MNAVTDEGRARTPQQQASDAQAQLAAMREILDVISQNQDDVQPVFEAVLRRAATLSGAPMSSINIIDEDRKQARLVAHWGEELRMLKVGQTVWSLEFDGAEDRYTEVSMRDGVVTHCPDLMDTPRYRDGEATRHEIVHAEGLRTFLAVPLMRQGQAIGNIALYRREVQPFTDDEIALVETFATQAVNAIENVRQFREVQTRLEREKGMAEVLQLISTSREDEVPVFDLILKQAAALCQADAAALVLGREGDAHQSLVAAHDVDPATQKVYDEGQVSMDPAISIAARAIVTGKPVHVPDMAETDGYRNGNSHFVTVVDDTGIRTNLFVPLVTSGGGIGALILFRKEVRPYTADEIALVETFAAQAVIAIENVRQFREVQTRL